MRTAGVIFTILMGALVFTAFLATTTIPMQVAEWVASLGLPSMVVMILILIMYLLLGTFLDEMAMILLTLPVLLPLVVKLGFDPVWFGIMVVLVVKGVAPDIPMSTIFRGVLPFWLVTILFVALLPAFPPMALWLPNISG